MRKFARLLAVLAGVVMVITACGSGTTGGTKVHGGTAKWAEGAGASPNYIFPLASLAYFSVANLSQYQELMYRPLYWFGNNGKVQLNNSLSLADPPTFSNGGKTVTIKLKGWKWSDGQPITSRDIEFWQNLVTANKANWAGYSPGEYPDNVVSASYPDTSTAVFQLSQAYGSYFFTYNELSQITPMPQHLWDKTSASGAVGNYDRTPAGAKAVYTFLDGQAKQLSSYATNPLWQVVDGPWKMDQFNTDGFVDMVPNTNYSGPTKPTLAHFQELPFTSEDAEFNVLRSGAVDFGYLPIADLSQKTYLKTHGYSFQPWTGWQITYFPENFNNPTAGAIFKQLYFRQAMQYLVDQKGMIRDVFKGYAYPTYGPVPVKPDNSFADSYEKNNPYPYNPSKAVSLLKNNGWTVNPGGVSTCSGSCGTGVKSGAKASFSLEYASGTPEVANEMQILKTDFSKAGIQLNLSSAPFNTVISDAASCSPGPACKWQMANWGGGWIFSPDYYPTGDEIFSTGAGSNSGSYSDPTNDANTKASEASNSVSALHTYEDYLAKQLPVVWIPVAYAQLAEYKTNLHGVTPLDPLLTIYPENWYFTK